MRLLPAALLRCLALLLTLASCFPAAAQKVVTYKPSPAQRAATATYWTEARLRAAVPMPQPERATLSAACGPSGPRIRAMNGITPGWDPAGLPANANRSGQLRPHTPIIPPQTGYCADCSCSEPYNSTFYVSPDLYAAANADLPYRAVGKVYFTMGEGAYSCSGAAIGGSAVLTAGHCVSNGAGVFHRNWVFIPLYHNHQTPEVYWWQGVEFYTFAAFHQSLDLGRDVGFAVVKGYRPPVPLGYPGDLTAPISARLSEVTGHLGFAWNQDPASLWNLFGYPTPFYGGQVLIQTTASGACRDTGYTPNPVGVGSKLKSGASGGPWVLNFRPTLATGGANYAGGVVSFQKVGNAQIFSPYFDQDVKDMKDLAVSRVP